MENKQGCDQGLATKNFEDKLDETVKRYGIVETLNILREAFRNLVYDWDDEAKKCIDSLKSK